MNTKLEQAIQRRGQISSELDLTQESLEFAVSERNHQEIERLSAKLKKLDLLYKKEVLLIRELRGL